MSNYDAFQKESISKLIEPFAKGMSDHITIIKYEAITPDIFALLFRTTGNNSEDKPENHFFVSLEFDYIENLQVAKNLIENWHGNKVIEFFNPEDDASSEDPRFELNEMYQTLLAKVERPNGSGYWAKNEVVTDPNAIEDFVSKLDAKLQEDVRKSLEKIFKDFPGVSISVYIAPSGTVEYFYS